MIITFPKVTRKIALTFKCGECGHLTHRTVSVFCTVNPYNKNPDGTIRSPEEVVRQADALLQKDREKTIAMKEETHCFKCGGNVKLRVPR